MQLHDATLKFITTSVGENSFLLLHVGILSVVYISKTAKTEVSATEGEKFVQTAVDECQQIRRRGFNLAVTRWYFECCNILKTAKTKVSATKE